MPARFELRAFGGAVLAGPDGPVQGRAAHRRRLALLAILAAASGRTLGRERILGYLWPDQPSDAGRHQLSEALYVLRKAVGEGAFVTAGDEVGINPAVIAADVARFREAVGAGRFGEAVELYRGPFLDGFYVADAPEFERWVEEERSALAEAFADAVQSLAERCEAGSDWRGAAGWWRRLAAHDPYSSRVALRLMSALAAADERAAALKHAAAHAAFLREELGVDPDAAVAELAERLAAETAALPRLEPRALRPDDASPDGGTIEDAEAVDADADAPEPEPRHEVPPAVAPRIGPSMLARTVGYVGAAMLGALFILAALRMLPTSRADAEVARGAELDPRRIAVLPFEAPADPHLEMLAAALTGSMIDRLSEVASLRVVSRGGVVAYAGRAVPLDSITRRLQVGTLVTARVQRSDALYRVAVQMVDGATGEQVGSTQVEVRETELFALQDAVAGEVERFLRQRLGDHVRLRERRAGTRSAEAYALVLQAEQLREDARRVGASEHTRDSASTLGLLAEADALLAEAERLDRRWVEPSLLRGWVWLTRARLAERGGEVRALSAALGHAERALALARNHPRALELRGTIHWTHVVLHPGPDGDSARLAAAEADLREALRRDPRLATAWATLSQFLRFHGDLAEAERAAERALEADAYLEEAPLIVERLYRAALAVPDYGMARRWCERGRREFVDDWRFVECRLVLMARDASAAADVRVAGALLREAEEMYPAEQARRDNRAYTPVHREMMFAAVLARAGRADSARAILERSRARVDPSSERGASFAYDEAYVWLNLGDTVRARRALGEITTRRPHLREWLSREPVYRRLRPAASHARE